MIISALLYFFERYIVTYFLEAWLIGTTRHGFIHSNSTALYCAVIMGGEHQLTPVLLQDSISPIRVPPTSPTTLPVKGLHHHRTHSVGPLPAHRITRRKSMSANTANFAAVAQAASEAVQLSSTAVGVGLAGGGAAGLGKLQEGGVDNNEGLSGYPSPPSSLPNPGPLSNAAATSDGIQQLRKNGTALLSGSAIADGHAPEVSRGARSRRASEGAGALGAVGKIGRMRSGSELKCEKCGKGYKHSSCLTKHLFVFPLRVFKDWFRGDKNCFLFTPTHTWDHHYIQPAVMHFHSQNNMIPLFPFLITITLTSSRICRATHPLVHSLKWCI